MQTISDQALSLIRQSMPEFLDAVSAAKAHALAAKRPARLTLDLDHFEDNPFLLYACLWYLRSERVEARMLPE